ncbi:AAA family ATPase [Xinfangfangia sp. D13-10-4-6]|uniref:AAA family ATPase n=1 Tax=Pseudogemmobacter hezensis TaxID=2737662 RepID=UPI0015568D1C|nr:AAA family ATPase [Pseudogemmobacter hezensis]NPD16966.1 AAA family ATPase [Pseudogemmobacter hezensis]
MASRPAKAISLPNTPCRVLAIQPVAGGVGASTLAVNLATELALLPDAPEVCLIDLNLQFGSIGTYLDLPTNSRVTDAYRQLSTLDHDSFQSCLIKANEHLRVFPAPAEILPIDGISEHDLRRILSHARSSADLILIDLPHIITDWSGAAWTEAELIFTISRNDVRSAQNMSRLLALLRAERLAEGRMFHLLNQVPARPDPEWLAARSGFEKGLGTPFFRQFSDGGLAIVNACNSGIPLRRAAPGNPLTADLLGLVELLQSRIQIRRTATEAGAL